MAGKSKGAAAYCRVNKGSYQGLLKTFVIARSLRRNDPARMCALDCRASLAMTDKCQTSTNYGKNPNKYAAYYRAKRAAAYCLTKIAKVRNLIKKMAAFYIALCLAVISCVPAFGAQNAAFRLDMDNLRLQKGVGANFIVMFENARGAEVAEIIGIENFDILSTSRGTSTSIVNGKTTVIEYVNYVVMPKVAGQFELKAIISYGGLEYETNALDVTIVENGAGAGDSRGELFVDTVISKTDAWLGEKIVLTYELYTALNVGNAGFTDYTAIDGIIVKDMPSEQLKAEFVYLDGVRYIKYEIKRLILDPIKSGEFIIPSFNVQVNVTGGANRSIGPGGAFGGLPGGIFGSGPGSIFDTSAPRYLQTDELLLSVKPLPSDGRPGDFSGIVSSRGLTAGTAVRN